jgi:hypothetical protein
VPRQRGGEEGDKPAGRSADEPAVELSKVGPRSGGGGVEVGEEMVVLGARLV